MPRVVARPRGGVQACQRCRRRKQKCDHRFPQCSNCEGANTPCLSFHSGKQADIPRDYVSQLEDEIAKLTEEVRVLRQEPRDRPSTRGSTFTTASAGLGSFQQPPAASQGEGYPSDIQHASRGSYTSPLTHDAIQRRQGRDTVEQRISQHERLPRPGRNYGINFSRIVMASIQMDQDISSAIPTASAATASPDQYPTLSPASNTNTSYPDKASLPPRHVADHLLEVYFQYRTPHMPILGRVEAAEAVNNAYTGGSVLSPPRSDRRLSQGIAGGGGASPRDMCIAYMVFAIALVDVPHTSGGRPIQSDGCFRSALVWIEEVLAYSRTNLELLRIILLVTQFVALSPVRGSLWNLSGISVRLCIDAGLHRETEAQISQLDSNALDDRRGLWHCACYFDRLLCITLSRPLAILDESVRVKLPNPWHCATRPDAAAQAHGHDKHAQRAHNHLFTLSTLESEIKNAVHHCHTSSAKSTPVSAAPTDFLRPNWTAWWQNIQPRMQEWFDTIPDPRKAHPASIFASEAYWDVIYHNASLQLHRPTSVLTPPPFSSSATGELLMCFESSIRVITGLAKLQLEGRVEVIWRSVHQLFMAGLSAIYCLWNSHDARNLYSASQSIATLKECGGTLWSMAETFPGAGACRDTFDALSVVTMDWLSVVGGADRADEVRRANIEFEMCVQGLRRMLRLRSESDEGVYGGIYGSMDHIRTILLTGGAEIGELLQDAAQWPVDMERPQS